MRVENDGPMIVPLKLWSAAALARKDLRAQLGLGLFYGVVVVMIGPAALEVIQPHIPWLRTDEIRMLMFAWTRFDPAGVLNPGRGPGGS